MKKPVVIIPARLNSSRLPEKLLRKLGGCHLLTVTYRRAKALIDKNIIDDVWIATDSPRIQDALAQETTNILMTNPQHNSGTERIIETLPTFAHSKFINIQGDEPFFPQEAVEKIANRLEHLQSGIVTCSTPLKSIEDFKDPNTVKVVTNPSGQALYFSRASIPLNRDNPKDITHVQQHIGIYGYTRDVLQGWNDLDIPELEKIEKLEQLRALVAGIPIYVIQIESSSRGIDTDADLRWAQTFFSQANEENNEQS